MALFVSSMQACITYDPPPPSTDYTYDEGSFYTYYDVAAVESFYLECEGLTPYAHTPESCDVDPYGEWTCCIWDLGLGCYEDWCIWHADCEWSYADFTCYY